MLTSRYVPDPIWGILLRVERRNMRWLAERTGWRLATLYAYSAGQRRPSVEFCEAASKAMGYGIKELFYDVRKHRRTIRGPKSLREEKA